MKNGKIRRIRDNIELGESKGEDWGRERGDIKKKSQWESGENGWGWGGGKCRQKQYREIILFSAY